MPLYRWATFQDLLVLQERMNQILEEAIRRVGLAPEERASGHWRPSSDMYETAEGVHLTVELPGVPRSGIDLEVVGDRLVIKGERPTPADMPKEAFLRMERTYGPFRREFHLPEGLDAAATVAEFDEGVVVIRIPRLPSDEGTAP